MYTEREKIRYVEMMWAEGLTPRAAQKKWGIPTRDTLSKWIREAERGELAAVRPKMNKQIKHEPHAHYPQATKEEAIRLYRLGEKPAHIARRLGISRACVISGWDKLAKKNAIISETGVEVASHKDTKKVIAQMTKEPKQNSKEVVELRAELEEALLEVSAYKELMRDPKVVSPASLSKRQLVGLGEKLRRDYGYSLVRILMFLDISKSTYHYHRVRLNEDTHTSDESFDKALIKAFIKSKGTYGYRRLKEELETNDICAPERKVRESMKRQGLVARCSRSEKKWSSYAGEISDAPDNLLLNEHKRHIFSTDAPNKLWLTDITEMKGSDGKCYLSIILDCFDGKVVAWRISTSPDAALANDTLRDAIATLRKGQCPIIHSDRGGHYRWKGWMVLCAQAKLVRSMSRKGYSPDNAACEGFFGRAKVEFFHSLVRSGSSVAELFEAIEDYIPWYNTGRLKTFKKNGKKTSCETIEGRRKRLGLAA